MHISQISIKNFRGLTNISSELGKYVNVIVGPNGVGKTTVLQAIRLAKALAAPRTPNETNQVLISLGAVSPHFPQRINVGALAADVAIPVEIIITYELNLEEIEIIKNSKAEIANIVVSTQAGQNFTNPALLAQFFQSPQGVMLRNQANNDIEKKLSKLSNNQYLQIGINISTGGINIIDPLAGNILAHLDQRLPPSTTVFSYFPADRAMPIGEANLQLGGPDLQQQLESHNSQPQLKYNRLKNIIINSLMMSSQTNINNTRKTVQEEFETIFSDLLKSKKIKSISINEIGLLTVFTEDIATGKIIELDALSSGEKNIALTYLILGQSMDRGGVALFDEPELHLNPAVSKDLLRFTLGKYSKPNQIQIIMCSHSPEILSGAFSSVDCRLLHLKSNSDITQVGRDSLSEYSDAIEKLGASVSESLLYEGTIFVEGESDVRFLELSFPEQTRKYKIKAMGGRREIEKAIESLQTLTSLQDNSSRVYLIFDKDESPTNLESTEFVRIHQWKRRCIENYMLDSVVISNILKSSKYTSSPINSEGKLSKCIKDLAFSQIQSIAARDLYNDLSYQNSSATKYEFIGSPKDIVFKLFDRMDGARRSLSTDSRDVWCSQFEAKLSAKISELELLWEARWKDLCDGKAVIKDLYHASDMRIPMANFRDLIIEGMRNTQSEDWQLVKSALADLMAV